MNKTTIINKVYATPPINVNDFRTLITAEVNILKESPDLVKKVMSTSKRAQVCVNRNGGQVEVRGQ